MSNGNQLNTIKLCNSNKKAMQNEDWNKKIHDELETIVIKSIVIGGDDYNDRMLNKKMRYYLVIQPYNNKFAKYLDSLGLGFRNKKVQAGALSGVTVTNYYLPDGFVVCMHTYNKNETGEMFINLMQSVLSKCGIRSKVCCIDYR